MTVAEASKNWGISIKTILGYMAEGLIYDITIQDAKLMLPDINKPKIIKKNHKGKNRYISNWIMEACENGEYINADIVGTDIIKFDEYIKQLLNNNCIMKISDTRSGTNIGYMLTDIGSARIHPKNNTVINILPINVTLKGNAGIGNIMM